MKSVNPALLTRKEIDFLSGKLALTALQRARLNYNIRRKLDTFKQLELPLLQSAGFTVIPAGKDTIPISRDIRITDSNLSYITSSTNLGKGPSPSQDRVLIF